MNNETTKQIIQHLAFNPRIRNLNYKCDYVGVEYAQANGFYYIADDLYLTYKAYCAGKRPKYECLLQLKPLIDLYQNTDIIVVNMCTAYEEWIDSFNNDSERIYTSILQAPYEIFVWCLENHYDVFNLIGEGYAEASE